MSGNGATTDLAAIVAANIRSARAALGLTQREVALKLGTGDVMAVSRWERGEHKPNDANLIALAGVLGKPVAWFYTDHIGAAA